MSGSMYFPKNVLAKIQSSKKSGLLVILFCFVFITGNVRVQTTLLMSRDIKKSYEQGVRSMDGSSDARDRPKPELVLEALGFW